MNKHKLYNLWHHFRKLSLAGLVVALVASGAISIYALRANNLKMLELKQAVLTADQQDLNIETALNNLRQFVYSHMNTNLRTGSNSDELPIQLVNKFNRDVATARAQLAAKGGSDQIYKDAQNKCEQLSLAIPARAQCIEDYVTAHGSDIPQLNLPPKEAYTFDFASPIWSPDLAGWSLVITAILGLLLIARLLASLFIKGYLKKS